jgi:hypothetical protein
MNDHQPLPLRRWQWKKQTDDAVIDEDDSPEAQEPPGRGHTSLPNAEENDANLTNPTKEIELTGDPPLLSRRNKSHLRPMPEEALKTSLPPERHMEYLTLDEGHRQDLQLEEELQLREAHPSRGWAPLSSPSPRGTPVDLRGGGELAFEIAQEHCRGLQFLSYKIKPDS